MGTDTMSESTILMASARSSLRDAVISEGDRIVGRLCAEQSGATNIEVAALVRSAFYAGTAFATGHIASGLRSVNMAALDRLPGVDV
jgi:hypothetical protein